jgi:hypothetical protein
VLALVLGWVRRRKRARGRPRMSSDSNAVSACSSTATEGKR